jgi:glycosyltransferase EpsE
MHGALMFRRQALLSCGNYRVCRHTRRTEDYDLLMRMYARGFCGYNLPDSLYAYREDQEAEQRRKYRYRVDEVFIRINGFYRAENCFRRESRMP